MSRLPPAERFPLAVRKNIRDEFEAKKPEFEQQLSELLGTPWTINIDPHAIYPYGKEGWAKDSLGSCIAGYVEGATYQLLAFKHRHDNEDLALAEINAICGKHELSMDVDETKRVSYCGCAVRDGVLVILFHPDCLGTNISDALELRKLGSALNEAPPAEREISKISFSARTGIRQDYDTKISNTRASIATMLEKPDIKLSPNFDDTFAKLAKEHQRKNDTFGTDWESRLGSYTYDYFEALCTTMNSAGIGQDDMLKEGFNEAVFSGEIAFRIVDKLQYGFYCEVVVQDGVLYLQSTANQWGCNIYDVAEKLIDQL